MGFDGNDRSNESEVRTMLAVWCGHVWGGGPWFLLFPLVWIAVIAGVVFLVRRRRWGGDWRGGSAETVLGERYARGEITEEEYRQRLTVLRGRSR
jgi:putative membrane protein